MKKTYFLMLLISSSFFMGCEDELDRVPKDTLILETAYNSVDDLQFGISGVYDVLQENSIIALNSIMMDNCKIGGDNGGQQVALYNLELSPGNGLDQGIYQLGYITINRATRVIRGAERIEPSDDDLEQYNFLVGQAYALRAYAHYNIFVHYTPDMLDPSGISVPYVDYVITDINFFPPRNSVQEIKAGMLADLDMAETLLGDSGTIFTANQDFVTFLRARIQLVTGNYTEALNLCNDLIALYPLADQTQYVNMFLDEDNTEVIFKKDLTQDDVRIGGVWYFTGTGGAFMEMSNELFNVLDPNDVRTSVLVDPASDPSSNVLLIGKYPGSGGFNYLNDYKAMRISEIYLIKAEAQARMGQLGPAATTLKQLRDARFGTSTPLDVYANQVEAFEAILLERRIELAYEGHRYVDLRRFRDDLNQGMDRSPLDCGGATPCSIPQNDRRFVLPIPLDEVTSNPNIEQTPVWD